MNTKPIETHRKPPQSRELVALLITVLLAVINSGAGFAAAGSRASSPGAVQSTTIPMLPGNFQVVNNGPGDQTI